MDFPTPPVQPSLSLDASIVALDEAHGETCNKEIIILAQQQQLRERRDEHELRKLYLGLVFAFVVAVVAAAVFITAATGAGWLDLSDAVLITLLTTTVANVIGCLFIAFHWLFPVRHPDPKQ